MISTLRVRRWWAGLALMGVLAFTACGDDSGSSAAADDADTDTPASDGETAGSDNEVNEAFCGARVAVEAAFSREDLDAAQTALADLDAASPAALDEQVATVRAALQEDPDAAFEDPEFNAARADIDEAVLQGCDLEIIDVTGVDYAYEGLPDSIEPGRVAFRFTNGADAELHEMGIVRINDDVTVPVEELLELPEQEVNQMVTPGGGAFAAPGDSDVTMLDLEPGRYGVACFIPVGTTNAAEGDGPPHFTQGMFAEFTVS